MKYSHSGIIMLFILSLMSGCQQHQPVKAVSEEQLQQLAALIASTEWLRDHCQLSDIPARPVLEETAIAMARDRGWKTSSISLKELNNAAEQRYLAISNDSLLENKKCMQLDRAAAPFIQQATSRSSADK